MSPTFPTFWSLITLVAGALKRQDASETLWTSVQQRQKASALLHSSRWHANGLNIKMSISLPLSRVTLHTLRFIMRDVKKPVGLAVHDSAPEEVQSAASPDGKSGKSRGREISPDRNLFFLFEKKKTPLRGVKKRNISERTTDKKNMLHWLGTLWR